MSLLLNGLRAISARILIPWRGVWLADVVLDPADAALTPTSAVPAVLVAGNSVLNGTIDARGSSTFGDTAAVRVVGGRNGWGATVGRQQFYNAGGALTSTMVYAATAAAVGEAVVDPAPKVYGKQYVRNAGPASDVFGDRNWFVEPTTSVTTVGDWPSLPTPTDAQILNWDLTQLAGSVASENLLLPGMLLVDTRFNGKTYTIRDVEITYSKHGAAALVWCGSDAKSPLLDTFSRAVNKFANTTYLKVYKYRVILPIPMQGFALQAITPGAPDLNPLNQYPGLIPPGVVPSAEVLVGFVAGDPSQPYLAAPWTVGLTAALTDFATALNPGTLTANGTALLAALATLQKAQ